MIIAIDGPSAAGKGTIAGKIAAHFGYAHLDSGALYRAVALALLRAGREPSDAAAAVSAAEDLDPEIMSEPAIRDQETGAAASLVAAIPEVRRALVHFQREFASHPPGGAAGAVIDGRDIGTVVCPQADVKLFITATDEERARRRMLELKGRGEAHDYEEVLSEIQARDQRDIERETAPLKRATDALLLNTTNLDIEAAFQAALDLIKASRDGARSA